MSEFRFRAAAALELRRHQERAAAAAYGRADAALRDAIARVEQARAARQSAQNTLTDLQGRGTDIATLLWHRNWISRSAEAVDRLARDVTVRAKAVQEAERIWREARQRHRALERMRERAWQRFQETQQRLELKRIDELAIVRHAIGADDGGLNKGGDT
jgi:flagellar export protein FliJ